MVEMPTYQKGLCSEPWIVGRLGGLLTVPNLNTDMTGLFGRFVDRTQILNRFSVSLLQCSNGHDSGQFTQAQTVQLNYCTAKKHKSHKKVTKTKETMPGG